MAYKLFMTTCTMPERLLHLLPWIILAIVGVFELSTDIYVATLPEMAAYYHVGSAHVQWTLSSYLLGFSLLGCLSGPLSDSYGRRPINIIGLLTFLIGSFLCNLTTDLHLLILGRFIQGLGAGFAVVVITAIIKDCFDEVRSSQVFSFIGTVIALSPTVAPILGAAIAHHWGWKANFHFILAAAAFSLLSACLFLRESLAPEARAPFYIKTTLAKYKELFMRWEVVGYSLVSGVTCGGLWVWMTDAPFYMMNTLGLEPTIYAYYAALGPLGYIVGAYLNGRLVTRYGVRPLLKIGIMMGMWANGLLLLTAILLPTSLLAIYGTLVVYGIALAWVFPNAASCAVDVASHERGAAAAILNTLEMGCAAFCAYLTSLISNGTLIPPATLMLGLMILTRALLSSLRRHEIIFSNSTT